MGELFGFQELVKLTPEDHVDWADCQDAYSKFQEIANFVNESLKESESRKKLNELNHRIVGLKVSLSECRKFNIKEIQHKV